MNRVLVVFSDGLLSELDSARGLVSRSAWIRQAVEDKLMKEAVAPLVPEDVDDAVGGALKGVQITQDLCAMRGHPLISGLGACLCGLEKQAPATPNEFNAHKAKPKARRRVVTPVHPGAAKSELRSVGEAPIPCVCGGRIYQMGSRKGQCSNCSKPKPETRGF